MLRLRTLGEIRLSGPNGELLAGRRKDLVLLAYIARRAARPVRRSELVSLFWSERKEAHGRQSLRQALLQLRRAVGAGLVVNADTVQLEEGVLELDVRAFESNLATRKPREAILRWGGEFLPETEDVGGETYRAWLDAERENLRRKLSAAFLQFIATASEPADWSLADECAEFLPLDEQLHQTWIETLYRSGRAEEARTRHAAFVTRLRRELGIEPSATLLKIETKLGAQKFDEPSPVSPGSAALFTPDLIGRAPAMAELSAAWAAVVAGGAATVIVEGAEGMGKTRLCEEFLRSLKARPGPPPVVLRARVRAASQTDPWSYARDLLGPIASGSGLGGAADRDLAEVSRLVPAIRSRFPRLPEAVSDDRMLADALGYVLGAIAAEVPIAVFLDDLVLADALSLDLMLRLARRAPDGVLLLVAARPEWLQPSGTLAELSRSFGVRRVKLAALEISDIDALLRSMLEIYPEERQRLAARVHAEAAGNPFFASEIITALVDEGRLAPDARGIWRTPPEFVSQPLPLPASVRDAAARRIASVSADAQRVLTAAANLPDPVDRSALRNAVAITSAQFDAATDELIARRLLRPAAASTNALEFSYPMIRRVAQAASTAPQLARPERASRSRRRRRIAMIATIVTMLAALSTGAVLVMRGAASTNPPVIALGQLGQNGGPDSVGDVAAITDMLATNLARVPGLQVVSSARTYQVMAQLGSSPNTGGAWAAAARQAGATELIEGMLHPHARGGLRLDLRRVDLRTGAVRAGYTIEAADAFELVDRATLELAAGFGLSAEGLKLADVTTPSLVAYRFYEEGLRSYAIGDFRGALRLFDAALTEDSLFAMAAHYAALSRVGLSVPQPVGAIERLRRLADRTTEREQLLIRGTWSLAEDWSEFVRIAETLANRYPTEPDGHYLLATTHIATGDFLRAIPLLDRLIAMDSLGLRGTQARCSACDGYSAKIWAYSWADSTYAAERVARQWLRRQPASALAWYSLANILEAQNRYDQALAAHRKAASINAIDSYDEVYPAMLRIRAGDFAAADAILRPLTRSSSPPVQRQALWMLAISLRYQGRLRESLETVFSTSNVPREDANPFFQHRAQVLLEMGRAREAARLFDSVASLSPQSPSAPALARHRTWNLTHHASALAAAGDTAPLPALADTLEKWGRRSVYGRDWRLHHHARGLLHAARGQHEAAAAEFRQALYSPSSGYTRTNLELARVLLQLRRPAEAVPVLQAAFRGPLQASNLYVTHPELHEMLGRAWDAIGKPDSAAVHYRRLVQAWSNADPEFRARHDEVQLRLRALGRSDR